MIKKTVEIEDFNGVTRKVDCYFNIMKSEAMSMTFKSGGNLPEMLQRIIDEKDQVKLGKLFEDLILKTYGIKSDDGMYFRKSEEISNRFKDTPAYDKIYMELLTDTDAAKNFINGVVPKDLAQAALELENKNKKKSEENTGAQIIDFDK